MFERITESLQSVFRKLAGKARLSPENIAEATAEVRRALLSADVNFKVVKDFVDRVSAKAVGTQVVAGVEPYAQFIKAIHDELMNLMGPVEPGVPKTEHGPTVILMVGLQGSGKTTTTAKLARYLVKKGRKPLMIAADLIRPAAVEQLKVIGRSNNIEVFAQEGSRAIKVAERGVRHAAENGFDVALVDTQGRLHVDEELMAELSEMKERVRPHQVYLVVDAMTGQDAVSSAGEFHKRLGLDGVILTKLDGDARGGAALSVKATTGAPIKFVGIGEKIENLEEFHPDRMASRILGMGDVVTLVERAQDAVDQKEAARMQAETLKGELTFDTLLKQMGVVRKMGSLKDLVKMIPGVNQVMGDEDIKEEEITRTEAIIRSMTPMERQNPELLGLASRKQRIARGSGVPLHEVMGFLRQFEQMRRMMRDVGRGKTDMMDVIRRFKK